MHGVSGLQVQTAMAEARSAGRSKETLANGHASSSAAHSGPPQAAAGAKSSGASPLLAEGTETALLYVRFRAAAEPGLKGRLVLTSMRLPGLHALPVVLAQFSGSVMYHQVDIGSCTGIPCKLQGIISGYSRHASGKRSAWGRASLGSAGLLAGVAARAQRREYMQLLSDCQRLYCEARLALVADVVAMRMAEYMREPLPSLTRSGCSYLMQVWPRMLVLHSNSAQAVSVCRPAEHVMSLQWVLSLKSSRLQHYTASSGGAGRSWILCPGFSPSSAASGSGPRQ